MSYHYLAGTEPVKTAGLGVLGYAALLGVGYWLFFGDRKNPDKSYLRKKKATDFSSIFSVTDEGQAFWGLTRKSQTWPTKSHRSVRSVQSGSVRKAKWK